MWRSKWYGSLSSPDIFLAGGWWHDPGVLAAVGSGEEIEEKSAWKGWWNEKIVDLARVSSQTDGVLTILMTGRLQDRFADLIGKMVLSKGLDFDMICMKPRKGLDGKPFRSTEDYKQTLLKILLDTYKDATEVRIYEDREPHVQKFTAFLEDYNDQLVATQALHSGEQGPSDRRLASVSFKVIHVKESSSELDPTAEFEQIQRMVNAHNLELQQIQESGAPIPAGLSGPGTARTWKLDKNVIMTYYAISPADNAVLTSLLPNNGKGMKVLGNRILIMFGTMSSTIKAVVGPVGTRVKFIIKDVGHLEGDLKADGSKDQPKLWAARLAAADSQDKIWVSPNPYAPPNPKRSGIPTLVLGARNDWKNLNDTRRIRNWKPLQREIVFECVVREAMKLDLAYIEHRQAVEDNSLSNQQDEISGSRAFIPKLERQGGHAASVRQPAAKVNIASNSTFPPLKKQD
jgi:HAD domain family 1 in Swiss Army Knife RNA repair proteins